MAAARKAGLGSSCDATVADVTLIMPAVVWAKKVSLKCGACLRGVIRLWARLKRDDADAWLPQGKAVISSSELVWEWVWRNADFWVARDETS